MLVGLKTDLRGNANVSELLKTHGLAPVSVEQGEEVAKRMAARYAECSSKEMKGVEEVFELAMNICVGGFGRLPKVPGGGEPVGGEPGMKKKKRKGCVVL